MHDITISSSQSNVNPVLKVGLRGSCNPVRAVGFGIEHIPGSVCSQRSHLCSVLSFSTSLELSISLFLKQHWQLVGRKECPSCWCCRKHFDYPWVGYRRYLQVSIPLLFHFRQTNFLYTETAPCSSSSEIIGRTSLTMILVSKA